MALYSEQMNTGGIMKIHTKTFHGVEVKAHNDSNCEWVVTAKGQSSQRFDKRKWKMKDAMKVAARLAV